MNVPQVLTLIACAGGWLAAFVAVRALRRTRKARQEMTDGPADGWLTIELGAIVIVPGGVRSVRYRWRPEVPADCFIESLTVLTKDGPILRTPFSFHDGAPSTIHTICSRETDEIHRFEG